jgi:hypothetical protein
MSEGIPYQKSAEQVRTSVDEARFTDNDDSQKSGFDHTWMYPKDKNGKPITHKMPYRNDA